jgi:DNA-binding transcriptional regulator YiaG
MRITTKHAASSYGVPVFLDDDGTLMDYPAGIKLLRKQLGLTAEDLASACGVSVGTIYNWTSGRMPEVAALNVMRDLLDQKPPI